MHIKKINLKISGMTCDHCAKIIEKSLNKPGILKKQVSFPLNSGMVEFDEQRVKLEDIVQFVNQTGHYHVEGFEEIKDETNHNNSQKHLIIVGGGSAAFSAALQAHEDGARVTMINDGLPIGGTCVNVGCVPSKILLRAAHDLYQSKQAHFNGIKKSAQLTDFKQLIEQKREMVQLLQKQKYVDVVKDLSDFELIQGRAKILTQQQVEVNGKIIAGDAILVATGASPSVPPIPGLKSIPYLTNETLYDLEQLPEHLLILGGNYIGLEAAQMFNRFGSKVTVLELQSQILPTEDQDIASELQKHLEAEGIIFLTSAKTLSANYGGNNIILTVEQKGKMQEISGSHLLVATGRRGNTEGLFSSELKVEISPAGFLNVDEYLQANIPGLFAAGDVTGKFMFVYTAALEGKIAAQNALTISKQKIDYGLVPWVIFTDPQVAGIGLDENQAKQAGYEIESAQLSLQHVPRFIVSRENRGFIKLIRDAKTDRLLGARIVAPEGSELLMEIAMGMRFGITVAQLRDMLHPYLTAAEGVKLTAITFTKNVDQLSCCAT